jgi:hypothetical protein
MRVRTFRWKECLLIALVVFVLLFAMSLRMSDQDGTWTAKHLKEVIAANILQVKAFFRRDRAVNAKAEPVRQTEETTDTKIEPLYQKYKNKYALLGGVFLELLTFDPEEESNPWRHGYEDTGSSLPDWAVGEYGVIPPRRILQILGPNEMLVAGFLSEQGRVVHFKGWPTEGLAKGQPWPFDPYAPDPNRQTEPIEVAIVGTYTYGTIIGTKAAVPSAAPLELFRKGITLVQFQDLLISKAELPRDLQQLRSDI